MDLADSRRINPIQLLMEQSGGLYHSFRLPDGRILQGANSLENLEERLASFALPERLDGKRVLDIGPWDGFFTFAMERRGAKVTAIDYVDLDTFRALHKVMGSSAEYVRLDVSELSVGKVGLFDIVLCLGVLYHLRYPIEELERICSITTDVCIVDTFVADGKQWLAGERPSLPFAEFYERSELGGQLDNWWGPSVSAVAAWIRAAGFAQAELLAVTDTTARFAAHRRWRNLPPDAYAPVLLAGVSNHANRGRTFQSTKEEYIVLWAEWGAENPGLADLFPEIDGFAAPPLFSSVQGGLLQTAVRVPPGLAPGRHEARLKIGTAGWSQPLTFRLDLPPLASPIEISSVQDGISWTDGVVDWGRGGWMTVWVSGLSPEADPGNVTIHIDGIPHAPDDVYPSTGQINLRLRSVVNAGIRQVGVEHRGQRSNPVAATITGTAPCVRGLEGLADQ